MEFLKLLQSIRTPVGDFLISAITHLGEETFFIVFALGFFWCVDKYRGYFLLFSGFCGTVLNQILKMIFRIPRPWVLDPDFTIVESARAEATGYSFPSGHTQSATTLYGGMARFAKQKALKIGGVVLVLLIGFSRMYLGVHTPKDVIVSLLIGAVLIFTLYPLIEASRTKPTLMYALIAFVTALAIGNLLFVSLFPFPADTDPVILQNAKENAWKLLAAVVGISLIYPLDQKWIKFDTDAVWWAQIVKVAVGLIVVVGIKSLLKSPLNAVFGSEIGNFVRYLLIVVFAGILWPMTFRFFPKSK